VTWNYAYTPFFWPSAGMVFLLLGLAAYSWRQHRVPGAIPLMIGSLFAAAYAAGSMMEYMAVSIETKIFWSQFQSCAQSPIVFAVTCFILEYAWPGRWLTRRIVILQAVVPVVYIGLALTNDFHHLAWTGFVWNGSSPIQQHMGMGSWFAILTVLPITGLINLIAFAWLFLRSPQHRWPVGLMMAGQLVGRLLYILVKAEVLWFALPLDLLGMAFEFLIYAVALFGFRLLDPIPLARQTAIEQLQAGMMVVDPQGNIASLNPAAEQILSTTAKAAKARPIRDLLPAYPAEPLDNPIEAEINLGMKAGAHYYTLTISQLKDFRGLPVGQLVMLHDITEQKQAQAQILEQQRALATLQERERLARELHDSTGQVLGYASLKVGATRKLIADGRLEKADDQLAKLENAISEAHADLREYILNLRAVTTSEKSFFNTLQQWLDGYRQNYDLRVGVSLAPGVEEVLFPPDTQLQLMRILQEALSNARKHSRADCVEVSAWRENGHACFRIQDNGRGFDATLAGGKENGENGPAHYGLRFMRERAEALGGSLSIESTPGVGTRVEVEVPVEVQCVC
jgi:PAS domain S-box-containing protein